MGRMKIFETLQDMADQVGNEIGASDWITVTQEKINLFAEATGDHQWIHVDVERAKKGPFGAPIAHGFLTLSLLPEIWGKAIKVNQTGMGVNYGLNHVRFMSPVPAGSKVRGKIKLLAAEPLDKGGFQYTYETTIELDGVAKPACVAESLVRRYP